MALVLFRRGVQTLSSCSSGFGYLHRPVKGGDVATQ